MCFKCQSRVFDFLGLVFSASTHFCKAQPRHQTESGVVCAVLCMCMSPGYYLRKITVMHELERDIIAGFSKLANT